MGVRRQRDMGRSLFYALLLLQDDRPFATCWGCYETRDDGFQLRRAVAEGVLQDVIATPSATHLLSCWSHNRKCPGLVD